LGYVHAVPRASNDSATIALSYFLHFATVGVLLPFLPAYFRALGLDAAEIGVLLAISPTLMIFVPTFWGRLADRTGRTDRVLAIVASGALVGLIPLFAVESFVGAALTLALYSSFATAIGATLDSLTLRHLARVGGSYARLRLFGSLGFVAASLTIGFAVDAVDRRILVAAIAFCGASAAWSLVVWRRGIAASAATSVDAPRPARSLPRGQLLLRAPIAILCAASALHWIAGAPFHGCLALHAQALGHAPWVIGVSLGLGVAAEIAVMAMYPRFAPRFSPRVILLAAFLASVGRWAAMALADGAPAIILITLLHGLTFGAFFAAAVDYLARVVPDEQRATGQAVFVSVTFGVGGLVGYVLAGKGFDAFGGHTLFAVAAGVEVAAVAVVARLPDSREKLNF
jgi:PPP family 3-phenylpropionic acid transporter